MLRKRIDRWNGRLLLALVVVASGSQALATDVDQAREVARGFLQAVYVKDEATARELADDRSEAGRFIEGEPLTQADKNEVRAAIGELVIELTPDYRALIERTPAEPFAVGQLLRFRARYQDVLLIVTTVLTEKGWRVDLRWWLEMLAMFDRHRVNTRTPQFAARGFMLALVGRRPDQLARFVPEGTELQRLYQGVSDSDSLTRFFPRAVQMPLVEPAAGDYYLDRDGSFDRVGEQNEDRRLLVGLFGALEIEFELVRENDTWKVLPADYFSMIGLDR